MDDLAKTQGDPNPVAAPDAREPVVTSDAADPEADTLHSDPEHQPPTSPDALAAADTLASDSSRAALPSLQARSSDVEDALQRENVRARLFGGATEQRLGRYRIVETLGEGGMGVVFTAIDEDLGRKIALKVLHASSGSSMQRRLQREARAMAKLNHPNVVTVHEVTVNDGRVCVAMEFVIGQTLRAWLSKERTLLEVCDVFAQTARGLIAAHRVGIVHRDLKPDNVLVGDDGRVRVLDFGLAKTLGELQSDEAAAEIGELATQDGSDEALERLTVTGAIMGTPRYMAPEQFRAADCDARTDQFAFCIALYEALYKQRPFLGASVHAIGAAVIAGELQPPPEGHEVPEALAKAIRRGLAVSSAERFSSMGPLLELLEAGPGPEPTPEVAPPPPRVRWRAVGLGLLATLGGLSLIGVGTVALRGGEGGSDRDAPLPRGMSNRAETGASVTPDEPPTEVDEGHKVEARYLEAKAKAAELGFLGAAREYESLLAEAPESKVTQLIRETVLLECLAAYENAYQWLRKPDGTRDEKYLEAADEALQRYVVDFRNVHGITWPIPKPVRQAGTRLAELRAGSTPKENDAEPESEPAPVKKKRRPSPRRKPRSKATKEPSTPAEPKRPAQETDLEAVGR